MSISQSQQVKIEVKREGLPIEKAGRNPLKPFNIMELEVARLAVQVYNSPHKNL